MTIERTQAVHVIGGGLAGSEAAWQLAARGIPVVLHEMRPMQATPVHKTAGLAVANAARSEALKPSVSFNSIQTVSSGGSMPAAREACTTAER